MSGARVEAIGSRVCRVCLLVAMVSLGCLSSVAGHSAGTGGSGETGGGGVGPVSSTGGMAVWNPEGPCGLSGCLGSCNGEPNPDLLDNLSCSTTPSNPPRTCTRNCCVTCGIDASGISECVCDVAAGSYSGCTCSPPRGFPTGLGGGSCSPQGYATTTVPATAPPGSVSLKGVPCTEINAVCFTAESTPSSPRGCICMSDHTMHCGSVHDWFTFTGGDTTYN